MKLFCAQAAGGCLLLTTMMHSSIASAADKDRRQFDSHEHGVTTLNIALDEGELVAELEGPGMNFVGFEYPPRTVEQKNAVAAALAELSSATGVLTINAAAECSLTARNAEHITDDDHDDAHDDDHDDEHHDDHDDAPDDDHDDEHHDDHADEGEGSRHSEFEAEYSYSCKDPGAISELRVNLFDRFPLTAEIDVSYLGPDTQTFKKLTPADAVLRLKR